MTKIMIVEDDVYVAEEFAELLRKAGYQVLLPSSFENIMEQIIALEPDLILLDINLPYQSGFEICKSLKENNWTPVLVVTARDTSQDELHALGLGADDYLTKPCNTDRLLARINNLLKRTVELNQTELIDGGDFLLDPHTFAIYAGKNTYLLPHNEGKILSIILRQSPGVVTKSEISRVLWGTEQYIDENTLQVNIARLRKTMNKLHLKGCIENVRGQGYCFRKQESQ